MMQNLMIATLIVGSGSACQSHEDETSEDLRSLVLQIRPCDGPAIDDFSLANVSLQGHDLQVDAATGGGCERHGFAMCWNGTILESDPPQINLRLLHDGHGDLCQAYLIHQLHIDVSPIRSRLKAPVILHVTGAAATYPDATDSALFTD